jgi:TPR repeat protein
MYQNGRGLPQDDQGAVRFYKLAAEQGNDQGQANLAFMYLQGRGGLAQSDEEAVRLYKLAAEQGNVRALFQLSLMRDKGRATTI